MVKVSEKPVLVAKCMHGKVFGLAAILNNPNLSEGILFDIEPTDTLEIVKLSEDVKIERCRECE